MDDQHEFTVEYQDPVNGVTYYENVMASSISDAKEQIRNRHPDVTIRAVSMNPTNIETSDKHEENEIC